MDGRPCQMVRRGDDRDSAGLFLRAGRFRVEVAMESCRMRQHCLYARLYMLGSRITHHPRRID